MRRSRCDEDAVYFEQLINKHINVIYQEFVCFLIEKAYVQKVKELYNGTY